MIAAILGKKTLGCTHHILKAVSLLDPEESQCFDKLRKSALNELEADVIVEIRNSVRQRAPQEDEPQEPNSGEDEKPKMPSEPGHEPPDAPEAPECPTDGPPAAPAPELDAIDAEMDTLLDAEVEVPPPIPRKKKEIGPGKLGGDVCCESYAFLAPAKTSITIHRLPAYGWQGVLPKGKKCNVPGKNATVKQSTWYQAFNVDTFDDELSEEKLEQLKNTSLERWAEVRRYTNAGTNRQFTSAEARAAVCKWLTTCMQD